MKFTRTSLILLSLAVATSCGKNEPGPTNKAAEPGKKAATKKEKPAVLAPAGNSGLVPAGPGFSTFDRARLNASSAKETSLCRVERTYVVKGSPTTEFQSADTITITGWLLNPSRQAPESFALLLVGDAGSYAIPGRAGKKRADVSKVQKSKAAVLAGFSVSGPLASVAPGEYGFQLVQDSGDTVTVCTASKRRITISG